MPDPSKPTGDPHPTEGGVDSRQSEAGADAGVAPATGMEQREARSLAARARQAMDTINDHAPVQGYVERARAQVRTRPVVALGAAFALGLLLARI